MLSGLMTCLRGSDEFELQVIASAMHLSQAHGLTYKEIERDGFVINEKVQMIGTDDNESSIAKSIGQGVIGFSEAFERLRPELVIILGDRFEALAAAQTAMINRIPIAHIHGGEVTEGAVDESIRHAITKMANIHFVATKEFRRRVIQLGEQPDRVFVCGAPGIDNIKQIKKIKQSTFEKKIDFKLGKINFLVTYHPVTLSTIDEYQCLENLFDALDHFTDAKVIMTFPNADADGKYIIEQLHKYADKNKQRVYLTESLGFRNYLQALFHVDCVIGNSSSGLIEVPSFKIPTVNIGDRQKGRPRADSIIDCDENKSSIIASIELALSKSFQATLASVKNPYGNGEAAESIMNSLTTLNFSELIRKPFYDLDFEVKL
ncbi:MAG: UDP-N-acetylglucosamine 2-epimerase [Gammaproteobacteria bacterium]